jgi:hypothetical protein
MMSRVLDRLKVGFMLSAVRSSFKWWARLACFLVLVGWQTVPAASTAAAVPAFDHIFVILMENHSYAEIIGNTSSTPYINQLASKYGVAANYVAVAHPSLPNYLALVGGDTFGVTTDCTTCFVHAANLAADRVTPSGRSWKGYMESMPSTCFVGDSNLYVQKHNPFIYFDDIRTTSQCNNVVPYTSLAGDLSSSSTTPAFVWISPNLCNDMHDCSIGTGDTWLQNNVPSILNSPAYVGQNSLVVITWDEDDSTQSNQVATLVIAKTVQPGFKSTTRYDHYSLLKTIEQSWGLSSLTSNDSNAVAMSDFFGVGATAPGAPTNVTATAGVRSATVSWAPPSSDGGCAIESYTVTASPTGGSMTVSGTARSVTFSKLRFNHAYIFTVAATNCVGSGPTSASNSVTPTKS